MNTDIVLVICGVVIVLAALAAYSVMRLAMALSELAEAVKDYLEGSG